MFGRTGKIQKAITKSVRAALAGAGDEAYAAIEKLRDDEKVDAYVDMCHQLIYEEDLAAADAAIDRALALAPEELYVLDAKAEVATEDDRLPDAVAIYRGMYELSPEDPAVVTGLGKLLLRSNEPDAAVTLLEKHASSDEPLLLMRLGEALAVADRVEEALQVLDKVRGYYAAQLKHASFVDNPQELKNRMDEAARLQRDILTELQENGADAADAADEDTGDGDSDDGTPDDGDDGDER